jgi:hypothetical protein
LRSPFAQYFVAELIVIVSVIQIFIRVSNRAIAGLIAGSLFVALGVWIAYFGFIDPRMRKSASFWLALVHLGGSALPLLGTRLRNLNTPFEVLDVLGLPGPVFHQVSSTIYLMLIVATAADWWRFKSEV